MNRHQARQALGLGGNPTPGEVKAAYRRMALEVHPDRGGRDGAEFKRVTEAYNVLKDGGPEPGGGQAPGGGPEPGRPAPGSPWGAPDDGPQQDWSRYTKEFEEGDPDAWKEYEKRFWEDYNARVRADGRNGEFDKAREPGRQPDLSVEVDESLCIGCCSCEIIAPQVFQIDKSGKFNPKSSVINRRGAGVNKIMNAAETCPTRAIRVGDAGTGERLFPH